MENVGQMERRRWRGRAGRVIENSFDSTCRPGYAVLEVRTFRTATQLRLAPVPVDAVISGATTRARRSARRPGAASCRGSHRPVGRRYPRSSRCPRGREAVGWPECRRSREVEPRPSRVAGGVQLPARRPPSGQPRPAGGTRTTIGTSRRSARSSLKSARAGSSSTSRDLERRRKTRCRRGCVVVSRLRRAVARCGFPLSHYSLNVGSERAASFSPSVQPGEKFGADSLSM